MPDPAPDIVLRPRVEFDIQPVKIPIEAEVTKTEVVKKSTADTTDSDDDYTGIMIAAGVVVVLLAILAFIS